MPTRRIEPPDTAPKPRRTVPLKGGKKVGPVYNRGIMIPENPRWSLVKGSVPPAKPPRKR